MKNNRRMIVFIIYLLLGAGLMALGVAGVLDSFWSGMGGALFAVGVIRMIRFFRYSKDESYREKMEIETKDERSRFIRNKAWAWAGYLFVLIAAVSTIVLKLVGLELLSMAASIAICVLLVLYWGCYLVLQKKY